MQAIEPLSVYVPQSAPASLQHAEAGSVLVQLNFEALSIEHASALIAAVQKRALFLIYV